MTTTIAPSARSRADGSDIPGSSLPPNRTLRISGISRRFPDGTLALDHVSLELGDQELVAIVGASGCGKSTLLRIVAGLDRQTAGSVETVGGNVGYVFQDPTLLPWRTVQANVELLGELHGVEPAGRRTAAVEAIRLAGLAGFEGHRPRQLSGGMRMRVSLARALTMRPRLFLFDEPFGALDELTRERLNEELLALHRHQGFAGLFVTHSITEAVGLASRVLVMSPRPGRLVADVSVPFGYPRAPGIRYSAEFGQVAAIVAGHLRGAA